MLRFESPLTRQPRLLKDDVELGGTQLRAGETVFQMINAANRDPTHFDDPETFDIERPVSRNLAFGHGIHFCIGAPLARLEAQSSFRPSSTGCRTSASSTSSPTGRSASRRCAS